MAVEEPVFTVSSHSITSITSTAVEISLSGSWAERQINGNLGVGVLMVNLQDGSDIINGSVSYAAMSGNTTATVTASGLTPGATYAIPECAGNIFYDNARLNIPTRIEFTAVPPTPAEDESYLNKRGLTHFWENIDDIKQDKLTAGAGISITGNTISATGGGTADAVDWGHITGSMSNQTDLTTALAAKANSADLATVATSGSYNDLSNKPTIPGGTITGVSVNNTSIATSGVANIPLVSRNLDGAVPRTNAVGGAYDGYVFGIDADTAKWMKLSYNSLSNTPTIPSLTRRTGTSAPATVGSLVLGGNGTSTLPYAFPTIVGTNDESFWSYIRTTDITNGISEAYLGAYEYDPTENWWSGKKEARLALYSDLAGKANTADLATVATSGLYSDLNSRPTIGNALITIQKNGVSAGAFTTNATSSKTINITVPTDADDVGALPDTTKYGASISVSVNTTDYKVTTTLKDQDGNTLGTAQVIDLPLESVVVNGSYDSTNKKIALTLQNGSTIDIPVADLVAGLQSEITSTNKLASDLVDDTNQTHKFMTSAEKTKLSGIAAGAEVNVQSDWNVTSTSSDAFIKNKPTIPTRTSQLTNDSGFLTSYTETDPVFSASPAAGITDADISSWDAKSDFSGSYNDLTDKPTIPTVGNATLTIQKNGTNVQTFTANATSNKTANITVPTKTSDLTNDSDFVEDASYVHTDNNYTTAEKNKLAGIAAGAEVNVQANWTQTTTTADDYIKNKPTLATVATSGSYNDLSNKPTIPTVNNATLTIQKNGTNVQTFTANSSSNKTANITVPTQTSELTNNSGFVTAEDIASTSDVTPAITTAMIADEAVTTAKIVDGAITDEKIDWASFGSAEWPIINTNTSNNNVNTNQFYTQYEYTVPVDGVYMVMFSQRLTNGANSYDFTIRITYNNVQVQAVAAGGSSWVNWIPGTVFAFIEAEAGGIIRCQSSGGGTGVYVPQNGRVSIMRIR